MQFIVEICVTRKPHVSNHEGEALLRNSRGAGVPDIIGIAVGKYFMLALIADSIEQARSAADVACKKLLANQYIEEHRIVSVRPG